ncbi:MAG: hypothetical protein ACRDP7_13215 [Trebonia sp.]
MSRAITRPAKSEAISRAAVDPQDRVALDEQQDQQHRPGHGGQPLVPLGPAGP